MWPSGTLSPGYEFYEFYELFPKSATQAYILKDVKCSFRQKVRQLQVCCKEE